MTAWSKGKRWRAWRRGNSETSDVLQDAIASSMAMASVGDYSELTWRVLESVALIERLPPHLPVKTSERHKLNDGWCALILIRLPADGPKLPIAVLDRLVGSLLDYREYVVWVKNGLLVIQFAVTSASEVVRLEVLSFADGMLSSVGAVEGDVVKAVVEFDKGRVRPA